MQEIPHCDNRKDAVGRNQKKIHKEMQTDINEPAERAEYREKCKHYSFASGQCYKHSETSNGWHWNMSCDGECRRMKNYDKKFARLICEASKTPLKHK